MRRPDDLDALTEDCAAVGLLEPARQGGRRSREAPVRSPRKHRWDETAA